MAMCNFTDMQLKRRNKPLPLWCNGGGGKKVGTKWKIYMKTCMFLRFHVKKSTKHARFHVFSAFSASFSPHYIIMVRVHCTIISFPRLKIIAILTNFFRSVIALTPAELVQCVYLCINKVCVHACIGTVTVEGLPHILLSYLYNLVMPCAVPPVLASSS